MGTSLVLAAGAGCLGAVALSATNSPPAAATTVTVDVATGPTGPAGPTGPTGPSGLAECPTGFVFGNLVINAPGGQTTIFTCIKGK